MNEFKPGDRVLFDSPFDSPFGMVFEAVIQDVSSDGKHLSVKVGDRTEIKPTKVCRPKFQFKARARAVRQRLGDAKKAQKSLQAT